MSAEEMLRDLEERLTGAADSLYWLAHEAGDDTPRKHRLEGKREGALLAKSYATEALSPS